MTTVNNTQPDVEELINYLESSDLDTVAHFKNVVHEKLYTSSDQTLLEALMERYMQTKTETLLELMIGIHDTLAMHLFDRLNEHLKHGAWLEVCMILFSMIKKQPSWLHKIVGTSFFVTFLRLLKADEDIVFIMHGILILCLLIPCVPAAVIQSHQSDIFEVFINASSFLVNKPTFIPEVCALHLNVGVYIFFHRLYTMYPNNFLHNMRQCFGGSKKKDPVFQEVIKPMFEFVKFHPDLITDNAKTETSLEKWKVYQPHDVLVECQKISLDQLDMVKEATYAVYDSQLEHNSYPYQNEEAVSMCTLNSYFSHPHADGMVKRGIDGLEAGDCKEAADTSSCNPSDLCGMYTPPSSMTQSDSAHDVSSCGARRDSDARSSTQTLNDVHDRLVRSSTGTFSGTSNQSPAVKHHGIQKTKSFGSDDGFTHRAMFRSLITSNTNYQSTPVERKTPANISAPASPHKQQSNNNQSNKIPQSTELFRQKRDMSKMFDLDHISDTTSIQSTPSSPVIQGNSSNFVLNDGSDTDLKSHDELYAAKEKVKRTNILPCSSGHNMSSDNPTQFHSSPAVFLKHMRDLLIDLFPPAPSKQCTEILDQTTDTTSLTSSTNFKKRSPLNLLDDFVQYGSDVHSFQLNRVPLTSQLDTDWTYYGGTTPTDELKILQTQVQLLHIQLKYERYKCELHCLRNRRLFGSLQKSQKLHNEMDTLKDQISLAESKIREMKLAVHYKCDENRKIKEKSSQREQDFMAKICKLEEENIRLQHKHKKYGLKKEELKEKISRLETEVQQLKYKLFDYKQSCARDKTKLSQLNFYQDVTTALERELLIQHDRQQTLKVRLEKSHTHSEGNLDLENKLVSHRHELQLAHEEKEKLHVHLESLKLKLNELELANGKKDAVISDHKKQTKKIHTKHQMEMEALEKRFQSCRKVTKSLQSYITSLYAKLEQPRPCHSSQNSNQSSTLSLGGQFATTPRCSERCRRISSGTGSPHSHHDQSHRHSFTIDNPFRSRKVSTQSNQSNRSQTSTSEVEMSKEDSGIA